MMKKSYIGTALLLLAAVTACSSQQVVQASEREAFRLQEYQGTAPTAFLQQLSFQTGAEDCKADNSPALDVVRINSDSYILRQNPCLSTEAPIMYLLVGEEQALLLDTGDRSSGQDLPIQSTVKTLLDQHQKDLPLLVLHSHGHSDHTANDEQFSAKANARVIDTSPEAVQKFLQLEQWPEGLAQIDLGSRTVQLIPSPGHHRSAISLYDPKMEWLLTGDSFYPGRLIIQDWDAYRSSISRLRKFSETHSVAAVLGAHIELAHDGQPLVGQSYHPEEMNLLLSAKDLAGLDKRLLSMGDTPSYQKEDKYIIQPLSTLQKAVMSVLNFLFA